MRLRAFLAILAFVVLATGGIAQTPGPGPAPPGSFVGPCTPAQGCTGVNNGTNTLAIGINPIIDVTATPYNAKGDTNLLVSCISATSPNQITCTGASFSSADIGKPLVGHGTGAAGIAQLGTISSVTSSTVVVPSFTIATAGFISIEYGSDDTSAITNAISVSVTIGACVYFPHGSFWLYSQVSSISLSGACLIGSGWPQNASPFTGGMGTTLVLSQTSAATFSGMSSTRISQLAFYYPQQDGSQITPIVFPSLFESSTYVNAHFDSLRILNAYRCWQIDNNAGGSAAGRVFITNNLDYCVDQAFRFLGGAADIVSIDASSQFSYGAFGNIATGGSAYLANYSNTTAEFFHMDVGASGYTSIDTFKLTGAFVYGYRYAFRLISGTWDNSVISGSHFDAIPTLLSVEGTSVMTGVPFIGNWVYSIESFGASPVAAAFSTIVCSSTGGHGSWTFIGNHFAYSQGDILHINSLCALSLEFSGNMLAAWGQSTTTSTYFAALVADGGLAANFSGNKLYAATVPSSFMIGFDFINTADANVNGNQCSTTYYCIQDVAGAGRVETSGNTSIASVATKSINNGVTGSATFYDNIDNIWDKPPQPTVSSNSTNATLSSWSSNLRGSATIGASPNTTLTLTFNGPQPHAPVCSAQDITSGVNLLPASASITAVAFTGIITANDIVQYGCQL